MSDALKILIKGIKDRIESDDPNALGDALRLTEEYPDESRAWGTLAYANEWQNNYRAAIAAVTREMNLRPGKSTLYLKRGGYLLMAGDFNSAITDFTEGIALGSHLTSEPNREVLYFMRAEAYYQLGCKTEALADLEHVEDDCTFWTVQVRSKADLVELCSK